MVIPKPVRTIAQLKKEFLRLADPIKAKQEQRFFKTGPGEYAAGDKFIGVSVPEQRKLAKKYHDLPLNDVWLLLESPIHEYRLTALFILCLRFNKKDERLKKEIVDGYLKRAKFVNNWDLVDSSAQNILGVWLLDKPRTILDRLAKSKLIWERRIAIISTLTFIRHGQYDDTLRLAKIVLTDTHDLMHKATGWMLREVGNRDLRKLKIFLDQFAKIMPRTMLRYAIEKLPSRPRIEYLTSTR
jgi:3-methyladenine DNA glycosylase AlkD